MRSADKPQPMCCSSSGFQRTISWWEGIFSCLQWLLRPLICVPALSAVQSAVEDELPHQQERNNCNRQGIDCPGDQTPHADHIEQPQQADVQEIDNSINREEAEDQAIIPVLEDQRAGCLEVEQDTADGGKQSRPYIVKSQYRQHGEHRIAKKCIDPAHEEETEKCNRPEPADKVNNPASGNWSVTPQVLAAVLS